MEHDPNRIMAEERNMKRAQRIEEKSVGAEMADRLTRFQKQFESLEHPSELANVLTVRKVKIDLEPRAFSADEVKVIRKAMGVSQPVFAQFLGVAVSTVRDWEQGKNAPSGPACRMMEEMEREPERWFERLRQLAISSAGSKRTRGRAPVS